MRADPCLSLTTALNLIEGNRVHGEADVRRAERWIDESAHRLGVAYDPAEILGWLSEFELDLRHNTRWECGYFDYEGDEDLIHGVGSPAEAVARAVQALRSAGN